METTLLESLFDMMYFLKSNWEGCQTKGNWIVALNQTSKTICEAAHHETWWKLIALERSLPAAKLDISYDEVGSNSQTNSFCYVKTEYRTDRQCSLDDLYLSENLSICPSPSDLLLNTHTQLSYFPDTPFFDVLWSSIHLNCPSEDLSVGSGI